MTKGEGREKVELLDAESARQLTAHLPRRPATDAEREVFRQARAKIAAGQIITSDERRARMDEAWRLYEAGKLVELDEYLFKRGL